MIENCNWVMPPSEWKDFWSNTGVAITAIIGLIGVWKIFFELKANSKQKRTEFFLAQHRRLFDDEELSEVLSLIDDDNPRLAVNEIVDKKRKFLTFFEEIALLVKSGYIDASVAFYMFGYYARCARQGKNFAYGINMSKENWGMFFRFVEEYEKYKLSLAGLSL